MDFELRATPADERDDSQRTSPNSEFELSAAPLIASEPTTELAELPAASGAPVLCLMARDPHTLFAYWDIDWAAAFDDAPPADRKVHLRVLNADGSEQQLDVEPMAGSCYVTVDAADAAYRAEMGFYGAGSTWQSIAASDLISTPSDHVATAESDFATVPFHLSFQHMIDMLRSSRPEDAPLITKLADVRERARRDGAEMLAPKERELADAVRQAEASQPPPSAAEPNARNIWSRGRLERILGFGATSPSDGFGGSSHGS